MTSIIKVDTIQDQDGNNIINENADTITIGASGDTITIPAGATLSNLGTASGSVLTLAIFYTTAATLQQYQGNAYLIDTTSSMIYSNFTCSTPSRRSSSISRLRRNFCYQ
jgi:hypothetical protein